MEIDIITTFPEMFPGPLGCSIIGRALERGLFKLAVHNLRDYTTDKHRIVDDTPYGGGAGMVMKPEPIFRAVGSLAHKGESRIILLCPQGELFTQEKAWELSRENHLILICGHYEGIDERVRQYLVTDEISTGDYILTGGEIPAMALVDAVVRLLPGVLGEYSSVQEETFTDNLLEYPQYTRPPEWEGMAVPSILLSGHHEEIRRWRRRESLKRTLRRRPDLLERAVLTEEDLALLQEIKGEMAP
ncbi:MAG TPA: tRNA (guanosine(37)-N1)-methyltransferase TrmD [Firmicutes bacterium]|nr:tRNA (guanosine(37)-N1)-methyltransferase TrmD [Bacillota bacterium]